jgi:ribonuclease-3 family protein
LKKRCKGEKKLEEYLNSLKKKDKEEVKLMPPLVWAYVGDAVYELYVRTYLVNTTKLNPHKLHIESIKYVKAGAQANILQKLMEDLTEEETDIVRRTRNTRKPSFA